MSNQPFSNLPKNDLFGIRTLESWFSVPRGQQLPSSVTLFSGAQQDFEAATVNSNAQIKRPGARVILRNARVVTNLQFEPTLPDGATAEARDIALLREAFLSQGRMSINANSDEIAQIPFSHLVNYTTHFDAEENIAYERRLEDGFDLTTKKLIVDENGQSVIADEPIVVMPNDDSSFEITLNMPQLTTLSNGKTVSTLYSNNKANHYYFVVYLHVMAQSISK